MQKKVGYFPRSELTQMIPASILSFFASRQIPVEFRDFPGFQVDTSMFVSPAHATIVVDGFYSSSPVQLLQAAAVHYQGRYKNRPMRLISACVELFPSLSSIPGESPNIVVMTDESGEFQGDATEVLAVGMGISLVRELFGIGYKDIHTILGGTKRCDFSAVQGSTAFVFETKGRKNRSKIKEAIEDVFKKKQHYSSSKYGFVSHVPRNGYPATMIVVDPPYELERVPEWDRIARILRYYSSASHLAGFWRLGDLLYERSLAIVAAGSAVDFDQVPLEYANVLKLGRTIQISHSGNQSLAFISRETATHALFEAENYAFVFGLDKHLIKLLEKQDFNAILAFESLAGIADFSPFGRFLAHANDDGTVLAAVPMDMFR